MAWIPWLDYFMRVELLFFYFGFLPLRVQSIFLMIYLFIWMGLKWSEKFTKGQKWIKLCTWAGEGLPGLLWNSVSRFSTSVLSSRAGNSQRGGRPWLLIPSHIRAPPGLRLGTHTSTFKQKLRPVRAALVRLNKRLRDKTPPRTWDQEHETKAQLPSLQSEAEGCRDEPEQGDRSQLPMDIYQEITINICELLSRCQLILKPNKSLF